MSIKLSDYVIEEISKITDHVFLVPGGGCIHLVDSISKTNLIPVANLHEQGASICAESYSQYNKRIGVCLVTTGPGATNALTGVASAWLDSIPLIIITGQVQNKHRVKNKGVRQLGFQEIDTASIYKNITKYCVTVEKANDIKFHFEKALYLANNGRPGPVLLDIPLDVQSTFIDLSKLKGYSPKPVNYNFNDFDKIINDLYQAKRPVVLVGNGVRLSNSVQEFYEFIKKTNIPVLTTWKALDLMDENNPQYIGRPGGVGQRGANFNQQNSDFILVLGARLDHGQIAYEYKYFAREAIKCIVDIDDYELKKNEMDIKYPVNMDVKVFLNEINIRISKKLSINDWLTYSRRVYEKYPVILKEYLDKNLKHVNNYALIDAISDVVKNDSLIIPGSSGACSEVTMQAIKCKIGMKIYNSEGLGAMGFGIPSAIGGCLASNFKNTICIDGDGGFFMNIQELELVYRFNLPIKFFILNNNGYASIKNTQIGLFKGNLIACSPESGLTLPEIELISKSYKIPYFKITNQKNLKKEVKNLTDKKGPLIIEVMVDPNHKTMPKASTYRKEDGSFASLPMEDLFPFLDRKEFLENLFIKPVKL